MRYAILLAALFAAGCGSQTTTSQWKTTNSHNLENGPNETPFYEHYKTRTRAEERQAQRDLEKGLEREVEEKLPFLKERETRPPGTSDTSDLPDETNFPHPEKKRHKS